MGKRGSASRKLRMTRQRELILNAVSSTRSHPTADEVYRQVRRRLPHISLGTVYRNLEVLAEAGLLRRLGGPLALQGALSEDGFHFRNGDPASGSDFLQGESIIGQKPHF